MKKEDITKFYLNFRLYIFPAVVALCSLILIVFVIFPQTAKLISNQRVKDELTSRSKFLEAKATVLDSFDEAELLRKVEYVLAAYPTDRDFVNVVGILQTIANKNGFNIITLSVSSGSKSGSESQSYGVILEVIGPESLLLSFINSIESSARIMKVGTLEISPKEDLANITLNLEVFYLAAPTNFGGSDSKLPELSQQDEELIAKLASSGILRPSGIFEPSQASSQGPRGKADPFE